ncbi:D-alanine--D-alanine ligase [Ruminococcaceae bacterium OttesenSCG-928-L11]|nr:D-alanine--D-alanine ligase [Ruminococcaceae bacterium OttesenSCG-928-L11]
MNRTKKTVCIVFGGASSEYEVSLRSATSVLLNINRDRYDVLMLGITREGQWLLYDGPVELIEKDKWQQTPCVRPAVLSPDRRHHGIIRLAGKRKGYRSSQIRQRLITGDEAPFEELTILPVDVVFPVLHGKNGEDGTIQGLLELAGIPYVGSNVLGSAACMDKEVTHVMLENAGVRKTKLLAFRKNQIADIRLLETKLSSELGYPMFVKPANAGSSVGVTKVKSADQLEAALKLAFAHDDKIVVEQAVSGQEIECAVMGNEEPVASAVVGEIAPTHEFYDYEGKYLDDSTDLYIPAHISDELAQKVRAIAVKAYYAMGCAGLARVDFFVRGDGEVILNEINTIPGFTSISMYAKLFAASGVSYSELITKLIGYALER